MNAQNFKIYEILYQEHLPDNLEEAFNEDNSSKILEFPIKINILNLF